MSSSTTGPMAGKTVLVTGGTGGIGKATAVGLAALGARVGIVGRDLRQAQPAATDIVRESGNSSIDVFAVVHTGRCVRWPCEARPRSRVVRARAHGRSAYRSRRSPNGSNASKRRFRS